MRLWSLHPSYLDRMGLVALWREALLAKAVLGGKTRGYKKHPQLVRFREHPYPRSAINSYLAAVEAEATARGYRFDRSKVGRVRVLDQISVTEGQLAYEWEHLRRKLAARSPDLFARWEPITMPDCHPSFERVAGPIEAWEKLAPGS